MLASLCRAMALIPSVSRKRGHHAWLASIEFVTYR
jgi:hypothetical protein